MDDTIEDKTLFRNPVEAPETPSEEVLPKSNDNIHIPEKTDRPLEIDKPYYLELMKVGEAKDHFHMPRLIKKIDNFIKSEIEREEMEFSRESYKQILDIYLNRLFDENELDIYTKTEKIAELMRIDKKLLDEFVRKESLLKKDILKMDSAEIKEYIELTKHGKIDKILTKNIKKKDRMLKEHNATNNRRY